MTDSIFVDGPNHPDLFDGETPIRMEVPLDEVGLKVYKVACTYYVPEEETFFVVAKDETAAEDAAWEKVCEEDTPMDKADVTELDLDARCTPWTSGRVELDEKYPTAREMLVKHIEENGCTLTPN